MRRAFTNRWWKRKGEEERKEFFRIDNTHLDTFSEMVLGPIFHCKTLGMSCSNPMICDFHKLLMFPASAFMGGDSKGVVGTSDQGSLQ